MNIRTSSRRPQEALLFLNTINFFRSMRDAALRGSISALIGMAVLSTCAFAQAAEKTAAQDFCSRIVGEWVGVCEQSTDGLQAENKYFSATIRQTGPNTLEGKFSYYKADPGTGAPVHVGDTTGLVTVGDDGTIKNEMSGEGSILVEKKPKQEKHQLTEVLTMSGENAFTGRLSGKISVDGLPFGVGKNGQVSDGSSTWALEGDTLIINQTIKAGFRVLLFKKEFTITACNKAQRGTDVAALINKSRVATTQCRPSGS